MEFGQWDAMGIYRGRPAGGAGGQEEEVSKWALCCTCATRSFRVTLESKATGLTWHR